ncbi:uncharacterized protein LOC144446368 [Glandiceps talaboti]
MATSLGRVCSGMRPLLKSVSSVRTFTTVRNQQPTPLWSRYQRSQFDVINILPKRSYHINMNKVVHYSNIGGLSQLQNSSCTNRLLTNTSLPVIQITRSRISWSKNKCKIKTTKSVTKRFYRLHNGLWVRRFAGYKKKQFKKSPARKKRHTWHVLTNKYQSKLLDRMVHPYWKERRYYLPEDDPWEMYHDRHFAAGPFWSNRDQQLINQSKQVPEHMKKFVPDMRPEAEYRYAQKQPKHVLGAGGDPPKLTLQDIIPYKRKMKWKKVI